MLPSDSKNDDLEAQASRHPFWAAAKLISFGVVAGASVSTFLAAQVAGWKAAEAAAANERATTKLEEQIDAANRERDTLSAALQLRERGAEDKDFAAEARAISDLDLSIAGPKPGPDGVYDYTPLDSLPIRATNRSVITLHGVTLQVVTEDHVGEAPADWLGPSGVSSLPLRFQPRNGGPFDLAPGQPQQLSLSLYPSGPNDAGEADAPGRIAKVRVVAYVRGFLPKEFDFRIRFRKRQR